MTKSKRHRHSGHQRHTAACFSRITSPLRRIFRAIGDLEAQRHCTEQAMQIPHPEGSSYELNIAQQSFRLFSRASFPLFFLTQRFTSRDSPCTSNIFVGMFRVCSSVRFKITSTNDNLKEKQSVMLVVEIIWNQKKHMLKTMQYNSCSWSFDTSTRFVSRPVDAPFDLDNSHTTERAFSYLRIFHNSIVFNPIWDWDSQGNWSFSVLLWLWNLLCRRARNHWKSTFSRP